VQMIVSVEAKNDLIHPFALVSNPSTSVDEKTIPCLQ
jgi:hypothetical protein